MGSKVRVLVVDDSVVIRRILTDVLETDPSVEVVGVAANGKIALQKIPQCNPDVITLDVEMPELDGIGTLREIRKSYDKLPVIMFSTLTERGAEATLDALQLGATDYCTKPANVGSVGEARERVRNELLEKIFSVTNKVSKVTFSKQPVEGKAPPPRMPSSMPSKVLPVAKPGLNVEPKVLVIGVSTGGPNALSVVVPKIPANFPLPIVCVQHMPPIFTAMLAERLDKTAEIQVVEGEEGMAVEAGKMIIAPGGMHMVLSNKGGKGDLRVALNEDPPENSCRPAVDPLIRSAVDVFKEKTLLLVLTGMGADGLRGAEQVKQLGGTVFVQDEQSSVVWGMPGHIAEAGLADRVLPLDLVSDELVRYVGRFSSKGGVRHGN